MTWAARTLHQNRLTVYELPSSKAVLDYLYPVDTGDKLQDEPGAVALSENGEYVVVGSWGTPNHTAGTEQIQVHVLVIVISQAIQIFNFSSKAFMMIVTK